VGRDKQESVFLSSGKIYQKPRNALYILQLYAFSKNCTIVRTFILKQISPEFLTEAPQNEHLCVFADIYFLIYRSPIYFR